MHLKEKTIKQNKCKFSKLSYLIETQVKKSIDFSNKANDKLLNYVNSFVTQLTHPSILNKNVQIQISIFH